jgi:Zinc knuckle
LSPHRLGVGHCVTTLKPLPREAFAVTTLPSPTLVTLLQVLTPHFFNDKSSLSMANRFETLTLEELVTLVEKGKEQDGRSLTNDDLVAIQTRMEYWQKVKDTLKSLKRTIRDDDDDDNSVPKRIDIKYESAEILNLHSSIRAWTDWKADLERMWRGAAWKYQSDDLKVIKATSKMDRACRARWTSYLRNNPADESNYSHFLEWTRTLIKDNVNFESTLYEEYQGAVQREGQSPLDFDAYLSAVERELPEAPDDVRANIFFSKLHKDVRNQIKLSGITSLPTARTEMVSLAQRMWEGLRQEGRRSDRTRNFASRNSQVDISGQEDQQSQTRGQQYFPRYRHHNGYRGRGRENGGPEDAQTGYTSRPDPVNTDTKGKDKSRPGINKAGDLSCHKCGKPGHFRINCPQKDEQPARIQHGRKAPENLPISDSSDDELPETD